jgi:glycosyltransferase involved in cell wall biosynthesis
MKLAIVCDDLIQKGGAEKVVEKLSDIFPDAPIYTSVISKEWSDKFEKKGRKVVSSFLQKFPFSVKLNRYYAPLFLHVLALESFDFTDFDVVISSSSRFAHFIITKPGTRHICYMHSPGRMFWEPFDYFENENYGILRPIKFLSKPFLRFSLFYYRMIDLNASKRVDIFIANSKDTQKKIQKYYRRDSEIIYPFIKFNSFKDVKYSDEDKYLVVTRLSSWKKVDIAIKACENLGLKLNVIGSGPDIERLKSLVGNNTRILGHVEDDVKLKEMGSCKAVIITQKEDFGIVPLEVMSCGKPVIAFGKGGVRETVIEGITGEFFLEQSSESLEKVLKNFNYKKYSRENCINRAKEFDEKVFEDKIKNIVDNV